MENTKKISKITIYCIPHNSKVSTFNVAVTPMSCELKGEDYPSPDGQSYVSISKEFTEIFSSITEIIQQYLEPTPEDSTSAHYEISITYDDDSNFSIKHATTQIDFDELLNEIHKLIPSFEEIPPELETLESLRKKREDLGGDMVNKVPYEVSKEYDID